MRLIGETEAVPEVAAAAGAVESKTEVSTIGQKFVEPVLESEVS